MGFESQSLPVNLSPGLIIPQFRQKWASTYDWCNHWWQSAWSVSQLPPVCNQKGSRYLTASFSTSSWNMYFLLRRYLDFWKQTLIDSTLCITSLEVTPVNSEEDPDGDRFLFSRGITCFKVSFCLRICSWIYVSYLYLYLSWVSMSSSFALL